MKIMHLTDSFIQFSLYIYSDGLIVGVVSSLVLAYISSFGLFNHADFSNLLLMYTASFVSNVSFAFLFVATCDTLRMNSLIYAILTTGTLD